jgi:hypothetical protein
LRKEAWTLRNLLGIFFVEGSGEVFGGGTFSGSGEEIGGCRRR